MSEHLLLVFSARLSVSLLYSVFNVCVSVLYSVLWYVCIVSVCCIRYSTYVCDCWIPLLCAAPLPSGVVVEPLAGCRQWSNYSGMWITLFMMMAPPMFFSVCTHPPHLKPHHIPLTLLHPLIHFDQEFSRSTDSNLTIQVLLDASITIKNRRPKGTIFPKYALFNSVTHLTLLHLSLTGVYKSDQLLSQLDIGWTPVGHQVDLCFSWTSIGHQVDFCHLWTLDEDMLDVGWTQLDFCVCWTWDGHQLDIRCRTLAGANKGHCWRESDQWAGVCQFWEVAMTWAATTAPGGGEGGHQEH